MKRFFVVISVVALIALGAGAYWYVRGSSATQSQNGVENIDWLTYSIDRIAQTFQLTNTSPAPTPTTSGITGIVLLGPTCPVVMDPPQPECADKPYATKLVVTTSDQSRIITEFTSDKDGKFNVALPPGEYAIRSAAAANILPYCNHDKFSVDANTFTNLAVSCDTGIR